MIAFRDESAKKALAEWYPKFLELVPGPTEQLDVDTRAGRTHVLMAGPKDAPPLVLVHGAMASSAHVMSEVVALLGRYRVIAPDVIGQSPMSADARLVLDVPSCAGWLTDVMDAVGVPKADLMGISWGGFVASRAAAGAPERFSSLVLLTPAGFVSGPILEPMWKVALPMAGWRMFGRRASLDAFLAAIFTTPHPLWGDWIGTSLNNYKMDFNPPPLATPQDIGGWKGPVLVFAAEHDLSFPGQKLLDRVRELFPNAQTELIAGSKHAPPFTDEFRSWLAERTVKFLQAA